MSLSDRLSAAEIGQIFEEEILTLGGRILDRHADGPFFFARSVLPEEREVKQADRVQGGVAMIAMQEEIRVHPYVFRQVCTNGAIRAHAVETQRIVVADWSQSWEMSETLRHAVQTCAAPGVFADGTEEMRGALEADADVLLTTVPLLRHLPKKQQKEFLNSILQRFEADADRSRFGLMNAITSTARDTRDPQMRWRLEEIGAAVAVAVIPPRRIARAEMAEPEHAEMDESVLV